ncbi:MAG: glycosyltransferase [Candidatus Parvarchaeota archaeon]
MIIVTYNKIPDLSNIKKAISQGEIDALFISDNSAREDLLKGIRNQIPVELGEKIIIIENGRNLGISAAINVALKRAIDLGYYFIHLLDDDASVSEHLFRTEQETFMQMLGKGYDVGAVCPLVSNNCGQMEKKLFREPTSEISQAITSGLLISRDTVARVGYYDERFFLQYADIEFTRRILEKGYKIFRINQVMVCQDFGVTLKRLSFRTLPSYTVEKLFSFINRSLGKSNNIFFYASIYSPTAEYDINVGIRKLFSIKGKNILYSPDGILIIFTIVVKDFLRFIATGDIQYIKAIEGVLR